MFFGNVARQRPLTSPLTNLFSGLQTATPKMSREYPIWWPRDVTQSASCGVLHFLNWQFLLSSSEKTQGLKVFAQGTMKLLAPSLKIINNL